MALNFLNNQILEVPFLREVTFEYKQEIYKVHVNSISENDGTVYKLYFKNTIEKSDKSLMQLYRKENSDGSFSWQCKPDYFSYNSPEIASIAGAAIDKVLQEKK
jgi:hypothetical protein